VGKEFHKQNEMKQITPNNEGIAFKILTKKKTAPIVSSRNDGWGINCNK
jgi:hypothetical protein